MMNDKRIRVITGHYGSGKTEFAVNYAMKLASNKDKKVAIADMDVVNLYFRSREKKQLLQNAGIRVVGSSIEGNAVDLPAVSAEVMSPIEDKSYDYIVDVGGDAIGTRAFARFAYLVDQNEYDLFFVVNANREQTTDLEGVLKHITEIETITKLKVTGLISNTHLVRETTKDDIIKGYNLSKEVSEKLNVPIKYVFCIEELVSSLPEEIKALTFPIKTLYMREDWM